MMAEIFTSITELGFVGRVVLGGCESFDANSEMSNYQLRPDRDLTILIPARAGSKRIPGKNTKLLGGKRLIQWTLEAAEKSNAKQIIVSSDDANVLVMAHEWGWEAHARKPEHATDDAPDILWVNDVLPMVTTPYVAICRPTSPFRTASTIRRGFAALVGSGADSIRAVERVTHPHPAKMWIMDDFGMRPVMGGQHDDGTPWHSSPTQSLPAVYKQNASLEIARVDAIKATGTISGYRIAPFFTDALEGFDLNTPEDWAEAERLLDRVTG